MKYAIVSSKELLYVIQHKVLGSYVALADVLGGVMQVFTLTQASQFTTSGAIEFMALDTQKEYELITYEKAKAEWDEYVKNHFKAG